MKLLWVLTFFCLIIGTLASAKSANDILNEVKTQVTAIIPDYTKKFMEIRADVYKYLHPISVAAVTGSSTTLLNLKRQMIASAVAEFRMVAENEAAKARIIIVNAKPNLRAALSRSYSAAQVKRILKNYDAAANAAISEVVNLNSEFNKLLVITNAFDNEIASLFDSDDSLADKLKITNHLVDEVHTQTRAVLSIYFKDLDATFKKGLETVNLNL